VLEENLKQLSRITQQERKQLSDELEIASVSGSDAVSFQQRLLLLSNKQKVLLKCFEEQKRLGTRLKLISGQNRYCTRSKGLLAKEEVTTGQMTKSQPIQLPSSSQLTKSVTQLLSEPATPSVTKHKHQAVGVAKQQRHLVDMTKQLTTMAKQKPQPVGVAGQQQKLNNKQQKPVGVAKQQQPLSAQQEQQQPVGMAKDSTGIIQEQAQKQPQFVGVTEQQSSPEAVLPSVGYQQITTTNTQQPAAGEVSKQKENVQSVSVDVAGGIGQQLSTFGIVQQQRDVAKKKENVQSVSVDVAGGIGQQLSAFGIVQQQRGVAKKQHVVKQQQQQLVGQPMGMSP